MHSVSLDQLIMPKYVYVGKSKIFWKHFSVMLADYCHVGVTGSAKKRHSGTEGWRRKLEIERGPY